MAFLSNFQFVLFALVVAAASGQEQDDTLMEPNCGFHSVCGSAGCYDANIADCADGACQLQDPLPDTYQDLINTGLSSLESLTDQACPDASNACNGLLFDLEESYCVNNVTIVAADTVLPCGTPVSVYCESNQACSESEDDGTPNCTDISTLCGDRDQDTLCSLEGGIRGEFYEVLLTKDKTGNLQFQGDSSSWGVGSFSLDHICDVDCSNESTSAPTSDSTSKFAGPGALHLFVTSTALLTLFAVLQCLQC